jgi:phage shock protein E
LKPRSFLFLAALLVAVAQPQAEASESQPPSWWTDSIRKAESGGYKLMTMAELLVLVERRGGGGVLLDVRPDYEYRDGHLPGAVNLEFHLGHKSGLEPEQADALQAILGSDKSRLVVTYCRNFR